MAPTTRPPPSPPDHRTPAPTAALNSSAIAMDWIRCLPSLAAGTATLLLRVYSSPPRGALAGHGPCPELADAVREGFHTLEVLGEQCRGERGACEEAGVQGKPGRPRQAQEQHGKVIQGLARGPTAPNNGRG